MKISAIFAVMDDHCLRTEEGGGSGLVDEAIAVVGWVKPGRTTGECLNGAI